MTTSNVTPIGKTTSREQSRRHARSRMAGRLFTIVDQLLAAAREAREEGEDLNDPLLTQLGGNNDIGDDGPLWSAIGAVCDSSIDMLRGAEPEKYSDRTPSGKQP